MGGRCDTGAEVGGENGSDGRGGGSDSGGNSWRW